MADRRLGPPLVFSLLITLGLAVTASASERVDLFNPDSTRQGYATIDQRTGRIDFYDTSSRRTGSGTIDPRSGRIDLYDTSGRRTGYATRSGSGGYSNGSGSRTGGGRR